MASEASQENFEKRNAFLTTKYEQIVKLEHLLCPKVGGGGGHKPTCAPHFWKWGGTCPPPPFYALEKTIRAWQAAQNSFKKLYPGFLLSCNACLKIVRSLLMRVFVNDNARQITCKIYILCIGVGWYGRNKQD